MEFDLGNKFEEKLCRLVEKYGRRETPLEIDEQYETDSEDFEEIDTRKYEYYFHYNKKEDDGLRVDGQGKITNDNKKMLYSLIFFDMEIATEMKEIYEDPELFGDIPELAICSLYYCIHNLRIKYQEEKYHNARVKKMLDFTTKLFNDKYSKIDEMIKEGIIDFDSLWYYLDKINTVYVIKQFEEDICFKYKNFYQGAQMDDGCEVLIFNGHIIAPYTGKLSLYGIEWKVIKFSGTRKLNTFKISPITDEQKKLFSEYADKILSVYQNPNHMSLNGKQHVKHERHIISHIKHERVLVDFDGMNKYSMDQYDLFSENIMKVDIEPSPSLNVDNEKYLLAPFVCVYNLGTTKNWGLSHIKDLSKIDYKKDSFDYLVLDQNKKTILKSLILQKSNSDKYSDFIENKGNGLVFLLYGPPGSGKTLTAEATCELLEKPMYSLNVGDLGTDSENMELILNTIIEYCVRWDAIIVIDEVDIFLEERETNMLARNAMVGIFLKVLEYHNGIMFLTTNRLTSLDPAVKSRITLMLPYKELLSDKREKIWQSLFGKWNIAMKSTTIKKLSEYKLNGREIRNYMKIVLAIHQQMEKEITDKSFVTELENCFKISEEFNASINNIYT